ncbi:MAG: ROK family protein [Porphyromonas sp.]|nr:ROK family protein [Porphyromonas sp.]
MDELTFKDLFGDNPKNLQYKRRIVEHIIENGPNTLPFLSKVLDISVPTTSKLVNELMDVKLLKNYGKLETTGGRHPYLYGLNTEGFYFLGVDMSNTDVSIILINLVGTQIQEEMNIPFKFANTEECLEELCRIINDFIDNKCTVPRKEMVSIGINVFGRINPTTGYSYTNFNFWDRPLAAHFTDELGIPTFIDNDTRASAFGEYMMHYSHEGKKNLLFINATWGLGLGLIIDGEPYNGKSGFSGEFGHIHAYKNEILCHCGKKGCLETEASGSAMLRKFKERVEAGDNSILLDPMGPYKLTLDEVTMDDLIDATQNEDILCIEILEDIGEKLGHHIASLINIFNPHVVVIGGPMAGTGIYLIQALRGAIRKYSLNMVNQDSELKQSLLMRYAGVMGASLLARKKSLARLREID